MDYAVAIFLLTGYLLAMVTARIGRRSCATAAVLFYVVLLGFESIALKFGVSGKWFFTGDWAITLCWFIALVRIGAMPCIIAAGSLMLLDIMMIFDAVLYPRTETALYQSYEFIAVGLHLFMLFGVWSISRGMFDGYKDSVDDRSHNHDNLPGV